MVSAPVTAGATAPDGAPLGGGTRAASAADASASRPIVDVRDVKVHFPIHRSRLLRRSVDMVRAVDGVSLVIQRGETLGLVGESGCGKTTLGRVIAGLQRPTDGRMFFDGVEITALPTTELRSLRRRFQIVFQDPFLSLNPRMTVGALIGEGLAIHNVGTPRARAARVAELMDLVGLRGDHVSRYPHEFSGGQRQRIAIARALAPGPELIVLDEPVSALDVSIQAQILRLLVDLQRELGLTYLLIGHDLAVIGNMCQRVTVMYLGKVAETADRSSLYGLPLHPYTRALLSAAPIPDPVVERGRRRIRLEGEVPSPINPPSGCRFHPRCPIAIERCAVEEPHLRGVPVEGRLPGDLVACHRAELVAAGGAAELEGGWPRATALPGRT